MNSEWRYVVNRLAKAGWTFSMIVSLFLLFFIILDIIWALFE